MQIEQELEETLKYFDTLHKEYSEGNLTQEKYVLLLTEYNAIMRAYRKVLDGKRTKNEEEKAEKVVKPLKLEKII